MARNRVQEKLDELIDDLSLTVEEREYLYARRKSDRRAKRVMNLLQEAIDCRSFRERRHILESLVSAVQELRSQMAAARAIVPEGFELVDAEALEALREMAVAAILMTTNKAATKRQTMLNRVQALRQRLLNLDAEVAAEVEGGWDDEEGGEAA
jgi:hypothetical protein